MNVTGENMRLLAKSEKVTKQRVKKILKIIRSSANQGKTKVRVAVDQNYEPVCVDLRKKGFVVEEPNGYEPVKVLSISW